MEKYMSFFYSQNYTYHKKTFKFLAIILQAESVFLMCFHIYLLNELLQSIH